MTFHNFRSLISLVIAGVSAYFLANDFAIIMIRSLAPQPMTIAGPVAKVLFTALWIFGVTFISIILADYFAFRMAKYWLRRVWKMNISPLGPGRNFFWTLVNFERWMRRAGKNVCDFGPDNEGNPAVEALPQLISLYKLSISIE